MAKNIKDYIGKKTVILCNNLEEWHKIASFDPNKRLKDNWYTAYENRETACIEPTNKNFEFCNQKWYEEKGYTIIPASEFIEEQSLTIEDLVKYEYYYTKNTDGEDYWMIYRFKDKNSINQPNYTCCITKNKDLLKEDWCTITTQRMTRKATPEEIQWLETCSKENKFIPLDKIKDYMKNTEEKWSKGGWVKSLVNYGNHIKEGGYYQIVDNNLPHLIDLNVESAKTLYLHQCEWIGMTKPEIPNNSSAQQEKSYKYEVVHCKTQEEWNFVKEKTNNPESVSSWDFYKENSCLLINYSSKIGNYANLNFFEGQNSKIYSFTEWCNKFNHQYFKQSKIDSWCVIVTPENQKIVDKWFKWDGYGCSIGGYYGITKKGSKYGRTSDKEFDKLLTTEQFYEKIEHRQEINMFKKDDYIVMLYDWSGTIFKKNYCFKQCEDKISLKVYLDLNNEKNSDTYYVKYLEKNNWRYATKEEIAEYDRIGKPFDVNKIPKELFLLEQIKLRYPKRKVELLTFEEDEELLNTSVTQVKSSKKQLILEEF